MKNKNRIEELKIEVANDIRDLYNGNYVPTRDRERFRRQLQRGKEILLLVTDELSNKPQKQSNANFTGNI